MNKLTTTVLSAITGLTLTTASFSSTAAMEPSFEKQLVSVCVAAKENKKLALKNAIEDLHSKPKVIALGLVCNGKSVIEFAESYGAFKTANTLQKSLGSTSITDIAHSKKFSVNIDG